MISFFRVRSRTVAAAGLLTLASVAACGDMLFEPADAGTASLAIGYQIDSRFRSVAEAMAEGGSSSAFDKADRVWVRVAHAGTVVHDSVHAFTPAAEVRLQITLPDAESAQGLEVSLELRRGTDAIFAGYAQTTAEPGATAEAVVALMPMPAAIDVPDSVTIASLGDATLSGAAIFVTGDTIGDATLSWSSLDPQVLTVGVGGQAEAVANGEARVVAAIDAAGTLSETMIVTVRQAAATVEIAGDTIPMGQSVSPAYTLRDANGFELDPTVMPEVTWTSDDTDVAVTFADGTVRGAMLGQTTVQVQAGDASAAMPVHVSPIPIRSLLTGRSHTCAIDVDGDLYCWGLEEGGPAGQYDAVPVEVESPPLYMISGAGGVSCGLAVDGSAYCRGINGMGQLGNGTTTGTTTMTPVAGGHSFRDISVGERHACALTAAGEVWCWGDNEPGQSGVVSGEQCGDRDCTTTPLQVPGITAESITAGGFHTCALTAAGEAYCWGWNAFGALGDGTTTSSNTPVAVSGGLQFTKLEGGAVNVCGIATDDMTYCWGYNAFGQLGNGSTGGIVTSPVAVSGGHRFTSISFANENSIYGWACGITAEGTTYCWGADHMRQLGAGDTGETCGGGASAIPCSTTPVVGGGGLSFADVRGGREHTCGVGVDGGISCWGSKGFGMLGNGSLGFEAVPVPVAGGGTYSRIDAAQGYHTCAITTSGGAECWGKNSTGQLGNGSTANAAVPVSVSGSLSFTEIVGGSGFTCSLVASQAAYCWGRNESGQVGDGTTIQRTTPSAVAGGLTFQDISSASVYTEAVSTEGERWWWGHGAASDAAVNSSPVNPGDSLTIVKTATGWAHSCWLTPAGEAFCRGPNNYGQLGDGTFTEGYMVAVAGGISFTQITSGRFHTCGLDAAGQAHCWGLGTSGQLGSGDQENHNVPVAVNQAGIQFASLEAGTYHTCGLSTSGQALCWGENSGGMLGDGTLMDRSSPVAVAAGLQFSQIGAGLDHTCGITSGGAAYCWGLRGDGLLGDGSVAYVGSPVQVGSEPVVVVSASPSPAPGSPASLSVASLSRAPRRSTAPAGGTLPAPTRPAGAFCGRDDTQLDCRR